jgi:type IX secretion system PorP/SprF family membrane protein
MKYLIYGLLFFNILNSQQGILMSNYSDNLVLYNPSYIGNTDDIQIVGGYRSQWSNIKDAPTDYIFSYSQPIGESNSSYGLNFNLDKLGPMSNFNLYGNYAYRFNVKDDDFLQLGIRAGMDFGVVNNRALDGYWKGDPSFREENVNYKKPVFGFGANYTTSLFSIGIGIPDIIPGVYEVASYSESFKTVTKIYGNMDFKIRTHELWMFLPAVQYRLNGNAPDNFDLITRWEYNGFFSLILGYRNSGSIIGGVQFEFNEINFPNFNNRLKVSYHYDYGVMRHISNFGNAHEITLRYNIGTPVQRVSYNGSW